MLLSAAPFIPSLAFTPARVRADPLQVGISCFLAALLAPYPDFHLLLPGTSWAGLALFRGQSEGVIEESQGRELGTAHLHGRDTGPGQDPRARSGAVRTT